MTTQSEKVLSIVDRMIANKITSDGLIYYRANDVLDAIDALQVLAKEQSEAVQKMLN